MEDGGFTRLSDTNTNTNIDFNFMDELFYDGFWLETTTNTTTAADEATFWQPSSTDLNSTSFYFPPLQTSSTNLILDTQDTLYRDTTERSNYFGEQPSSLSNNHCHPGMDELTEPNQAQNHRDTSFPPSVVSQSPNFLVEETEANKRLWVGPNRKSSIRTISVRNKLVHAINHLKESIRDKDILIQIWVPVKKEGRQVLTTSNQPYSLNQNCKNLVEYRDVSQNYQFAADEDSKEFVGLPGRVFLKKLPEWTPDVRFFKTEEYPRVDHAQRYDVRGSLALPVFERGSGQCLGVVEIVTTSQKVNYRPELENVCKALEACDLKSSNILSPPSGKDCNENYHAAVAEIRNVLKCVCDTHRLPLAQTWAPCIEQEKGGCRHSDENYACCVSTIDSACYVTDQQIAGFQEACSEHHLLKGEGIAGKAFLTNQPCFSQDIKAFSKTEYPLAHHARMFNLCAAVAIRLRSTYTGSAGFVLEFFLPLNCKDDENQRLMLDSLSSVIERTCQSLRVVTDEEVAQEASLRVGRSLSVDLEKQKPLSKPLAPLSTSANSSANATSSSSSWIMHMMDSQHKGKGVAVSLGPPHKEEPEEGFRVVTTSQWDNMHHVPPFLDQEDSGGPKPSTNHSTADFFLAGSQLSIGAKTNNEKRRTKSEKNISLQVLRQYFAGSLKDAAKNIGVCPTTLKRICRQHGITRWPSRKIKKVGHSLKKLQVVIDSVQGAEGSIQLSSFYNNFPELVSPNVPGSSLLPTSSKPNNTQPENGNTLLTSPTTTASKSPSSSGSHSSSSSYCCSTGVKQSSFPVNGSDALSTEHHHTLKRTRSDAVLHELTTQQQETKHLLRSYSHKIFGEHETRPKNNTFRVKAAFGEEMIRFSLQPDWCFIDLQKEVLRRFNIIENGSSRVDLKYLDDDSEWVLLTCDADLEECIDIHRSSKSRTIKLSLNQHYHPSLGSSFGSNGPY